jgi:hypothetical protein
VTISGNSKVAISARVETIVRGVIFALCIVIGIFWIYTGWGYFLAHLDTPYTGHESFYEVDRDFLGYALIILSPLVIKRYFWTFVMIGLAAIFYAWLFFAN